MDDPNGWRQSQQGPSMQQQGYQAGLTPGMFRSESIAQGRPVRRRRRLLWSFLSLVLVVLVLAGLWFVAVRPYLHGLAQAQIDQVLGQAVGQINPATALVLPAKGTIPVNENTINNLIVLYTSPSSPVQNMHAQISQAGVSFNFTAYNFSNTVSMQLVAQNGKLQVNNVNIQGPLWLIMSPDELTSTLNTHLQDASERLNRTITAVTLKDGEIDLTVG